jgi:nucleotide-binding universal stress UspA family protein
MISPVRSSTRTIVVGVDESAAAIAAVRWASTEAQQRSARLLLVHVYNAMPAPLLAGPVPQQAFDDVRTRALEVVEECAGYVDPAVAVATRTVAGSPGQVLEEVSADADLLVVGGSAHHSAPVRLALGSVAQHCVNHARCPVVVIPAPAHVAAATGS